VYRLALILFCTLAVSFPASASDPCRSGLQPGQRPGPYSSVISTGPQRGQSYCFICETADRPAVIVFARTLSAPLAHLAVRLDQAVRDHQKAEFRSWITFLNADQLTLDPKLVAWSREHSIRSVPLGVFEDAVGPPSYRLAADADVTVLVCAKQKVIANFAFRPGELNDASIAEVMTSLTKSLPLTK
jgi:hypothetical protein